MRHNDYRLDHECKQCGKPVFTPVYWHSKFYYAPKIPTCLHEKFKQESTTLRPVFKGQYKNVENIDVE